MNPQASDLRRTANLLAMLPAGVPLRQTASHRWATVCPFHEDSRPSLSVSLIDEGWVYKCFACGAKGDVITWVMHFERLDFKGAIRHLAGKEPTPMMGVIPLPVKAKKSHVLFCDFRGCAARIEVDVTELLDVGRGSHCAWKRVGEQYFCGMCCKLMTRGYTRKPMVCQGPAHLLADWVRETQEPTKERRAFG